MKHKSLSAVILFLAIFHIYFENQVSGQVLGASTLADENNPATENLVIEDESLLENSVKIVTVTAFDEKKVEEYEQIPFETVYEDDNELEWGLEEVKQQGEPGLKTLTYKIIHWQEEIIDKQLIDTKIDEPTPEKIAKGTKVIWRMVSTPDAGRVKYWGSLDVWATKYDGNCIGCTGRTYSGTLVKKGVCAVDPRVIPLGTNFYVEGYGLCRAEDIGGAIKGNKVDLGYEKAAEGAWRTGYTKVYLISNAPDGSSAY